MKPNEMTRDRILYHASAHHGLSAPDAESNLRKVEALVAEGLLEARTREISVPAIDPAFVSYYTSVGWRTDAYTKTITSYHLTERGRRAWIDG